MAEGLLFGVAEGILGKLGSFALQEIGLCWSVKEEIELLRTTVLGVKVVLLDAEGRQARGDDQVKDWLLMLKEVVYDADDLLDDFSTEVLRQQVMTGSKVTNKVGLFFSSSNQLAYGLKMSHKIKAIRKSLDAVMRVGTKFNFQQPHVDTSTFVMAKKREQTHSSIPEVVVGREVDKKAIRQLLLSESYETNVSVISIIGIGGLGKTSLAQLIYNDENVKLYFELMMWVCVSNDFDVKLIVEKILESVTRGRSNMSEMNTLKDSLHEKINGKRYLLVLDDIWNDDSEKWYSLRDLLVGGARGSKILITTRSKMVAEITCPSSQAQYELKGLSDDESWSLFVQMGFKQGCVPLTSHEAIGKEIVAKCKGVPLAIRAIGRLMYFKESILEWESIKRKELTKMDQGESSIMPSLRLSYDILPSHLKHCFAYCRLFPKDHEIDVDKLVALWMAQGYIKLSDPSQCLEDIGRECFMDLLWRSFFQDAKKDRLGNIVSCKMHDLMHDLASSVAGAESFYVSISNQRKVGEKIRHISFDHFYNRNSDTLQVLVSIPEARSLRTFLSSKYSLKVSGGQCHAIFCNLRRLRQLDLKELDIGTVPHSIVKLKQLRYLDLSRSEEIKMLPRPITRLQNLQVLKLVGCWRLRQLPKDIKKLVSLKHLDFRECHALTHMPRGIGQLTSLERLTRFVLPKSEKEESESAGLGELRDLNKLGGELRIENLWHHGNGKGKQKGTTTNTTTSVAEACAAANLREKPRLQVLRLEWVPFEDLDDTDINVDEMSLEALRPHPNLKEICLRNYGGMKFASWLSSLANLVQLQFSQCKKCQSLPALDQLPLLKDIFIYGLTDLEYIDIDIPCRSMVRGGGGGGGSAICSSNSSSSSNNNSMVSFFPSLETLQVSFCPNLKGWRSSSPSSSSSLLPQFQCLSQLSIESCPNLTSMPPFSPSLNRLYVYLVSFKSLDQMLKGTISPAHERSSSLKHLEIAKVEHLPDDFLPVEFLRTLASLEFLSIEGCQTLTCLPHAKMLVLTSLKSLWISNCADLDLSNYDDDSNSNSNEAILWQGQGLRSLTSLQIDGIPKLVHLPRRLLLHLIVLQTLQIWNCSNLASLPEWMPNLTSLQYLRIGHCSQLSERCKNNMGEDWPKIAHIPNISVDGTEIQRDGCYKL